MDFNPNAFVSNSNDQLQQLTCSSTILVISFVAMESGEDFRVFQADFSTSLTLESIISPNNDPKAKTCSPIIKRSLIWIMNLAFFAFPIR